MRFLNSITGIIIAINVAIFLLVTMVGGPSPQGLYELEIILGLNPSLFLGGAYWQPLSSMFLHTWLFHLGFNMLALYSLGMPIEQTIGSKRFIQLYFVSGLVAALLIIVFQFETDKVTMGASGAVLGVLGALAVFYPDSKLLLFFIPMKARTAAIVFAAGSILLQVTGSLSMLSHFGHLGGLIGGVLYSRYVLKLKRNRASHIEMTSEDGDGPVYYLDPRTGKVYRDE